MRAPKGELLLSAPVPRLGKFLPPERNWENRINPAPYTTTAQSRERFDFIVKVLYVLYNLLDKGSISAHTTCRALSVPVER